MFVIVLPLVLVFVMLWVGIRVEKRLQVARKAAHKRRQALLAGLPAEVAAELREAQQRRAFPILALVAGVAVTTYGAAWLAVGDSGRLPIRPIDVGPVVLVLVVLIELVRLGLCVGGDRLGTRDVLLDLGRDEMAGHPLAGPGDSFRVFVLVGMAATVVGLVLRAKGGWAAILALVLASLISQELRQRWNHRVQLTRRGFWSRGHLVRWSRMERTWRTCDGRGLAVRYRRRWPRLGYFLVQVPANRAELVERLIAENVTAGTTDLARL